MSPEQQGPAWPCRRPTWVLLDAADRGPARSPGDLAFAFDRRDHQGSSTPHSRGADYGPAIIRELAQSLGGVVSVDNLTQGGVVFGVWLPAAG